MGSQGENIPFVGLTSTTAICAQGKAFVLTGVLSLTAAQRMRRHPALWFLPSALSVFNEIYDSL